ncbi:MAG: DUF169 domain-containing protein [Candidatus Kariarchaeaceae archaeon]|jgi:uncharacterized protein (DUF169 family)
MNGFERLKQALNLVSDPIGVKLIYEYDSIEKIDDIFKDADGSERYCEYVKRASNGEFLNIRKGDFSCNVAEMMLGFQESGNLELKMNLDIKGLKNILLFPINKYHLKNFDSVILILYPHNCMDIVQAYVKLYNKPLKITCGIISGVCSEVTAYVIKRNDVNFSFLCPDSRLRKTFSDCELLCGIPAKMADDVVNSTIEIVNQKNTPNPLISST